MDAWLIKANAVLDKADAKEMYPPFRYPSCARGVATCCKPFWCAPCIAWSALGRLATCPYRCAVHGVAFMCTANACSAYGDDALQKYTACSHQHSTIDPLPLLPAPMEPWDVDEFGKVLDRIERTFMRTQDIRIKYAIAEAFVKPIVGKEVTPSQVLNQLKEVRTRVFSLCLVKQHTKHATDTDAAAAQEDSESARPPQNDDDNEDEARGQVPRPASAAE